MKLTKEQTRILRELENGNYIWTNEGRDYEVWLGDNEGHKIEGLRKRTVEVLFENDSIVLVDGDYREGMYKYTIR